jgi:hypothetical protein
MSTLTPLIAAGTATAKHQDLTIVCVERGAAQCQRFAWERNTHTVI